MKYTRPAVYPGYDFRRKAHCKPGDIVTCVVSVEAGYSNYAGNPECVFRPGTVGIVVATDSVSVRYGPYGEDVGVNVHFVGPAHGKEGGTAWRVFLRYGNIKVVQRVSLTTEQRETYSKIATIARCFGRGGVTKKMGASLVDAGLAIVNGNSISALIGYP